MDRHIFAELNLLPPARKVKHTYIYGLVALFMLLLAVGTIDYIYCAQLKVLTTLGNENLALKSELVNKQSPQLESNPDLITMQEQTKLFQSDIEGLEKTEHSFATMLEDIKMVIPGDTVIKYVECSACKVIIGGWSQNYSSMAQLLGDLHTIPGFVHIDEFRANTGEDGTSPIFGIKINYQEIGR